MSTRGLALRGLSTQSPHEAQPPWLLKLTSPTPIPKKENGQQRNSYLPCLLNPTPAVGLLIVENWGVPESHTLFDLTCCSGRMLVFAVLEVTIHILNGGGRCKRSAVFCPTGAQAALISWLGLVVKAGPADSLAQWRAASASVAAALKGLCVMPQTNNTC